MEQPRRFFYGWVIVFAGLILSLIMYGVVDSFGMMFKPIAGEFNWDRGTVSVAAMINWITLGVASLIGGALSDRFGSRRVIIVGGLLFVAGTLLMSQIQSLWHLYLVFGIVLAIGRSAAGVPLTALVTKWFVRNQGLALSLAQSQNVGSALFAPLAAVLLTDYGWRGTYLWFGLGALLILPLAWLMREQQTGAVPLQPLGPGPWRTQSQPASPQPVGLTLGQAMRTRVFWTLNLMVVGCCTCHSCILLHGVNHMTDVGLAMPTAASVVAIMAIAGMAGKIANGLLADRFGAKWAVAGFLGLQAGMIPFFLEAHSVPSFYAWAILFGIGYGGPMPVYAMLFREYYGTRSIGSILGVFFLIASLGMASGGMMGGVLYNMFGSYAVPFFTSTGTGLIAALLALTLPSPKRETTMTPQVALQMS
jgi:MFS family permease